MIAELKAAIGLIVIGASLVVYAEARFATKDQITDVKQTQERFDDILLKRLDRIENKIDKLKGFN